MSGFRRPLGLVLSGGGALGAWQAGCLAALAGAGLDFDKVLGVSAGAMAGAGYALDLLDELIDRWLDIDRHRILRFSPRLLPLSLFSDRSLWEMVEPSADAEEAKRRARCELVVAAHCLEDRRHAYWRFTPGGQERWDGPLHACLVASCAIPRVFPPVRIAENGSVRTYVDGGFAGYGRVSFDSMADCRDVVVLESIRPDEERRRLWPPTRLLRKPGSECRRLFDEAIAGLQERAPQARVYRVSPSRPLGYSMLAFKSRHCAPAVERGRADGAAFLSGPSRHLV